MSLAIAAGALYFLFILPHQQALDRIELDKRQVIATQRALEGGITEFGKLTGPSSITLKEVNAAKNYVSEFDSILPTLNVERADKPAALNPLWMEPKIRKYNELIAKPSYVNSLAQSIVTLRDALAFVAHHRATMDAVSKLLEYNPETDTQVTPPDAVQPRLEAAAAGLDGIQSKLKEEMPQYSDDTLQAVADKVKAVETARYAYQQTINESNRQAYIAAVTDAQQTIIANRQKFWDDNYNKLSGDLNKALEQLRPSSSEIQNL